MDAEFELGKAEPKLKAAEKAVSSLQKDDITNLKSTKNPNNDCSISKERTVFVQAFILLERVSEK